MATDFHHSKNKKSIGNKARNLIKMTLNGFPIPAGFVIQENEVPSETQIRFLYEKTIKKGRLSVRSSSNQEDGENFSGAGLYKTLLDVDIDDVMASIDRVRWVGSNESLMPVIVQQYVDAKYAGVAFSIDPTSGLDRIYMEYAAGKCDDVVSGRLTPDKKIFDKNKIRADSDIPMELIRYIVRLEIFFGYPVDVEWCVDKDDKVWILQCRPVTVIPEARYRYAWSTREPLWAMDLAFKVRCDGAGNKKDNIYSHGEIVYTRNESGVFDCYIGLADRIGVLKYISGKIGRKFDPLGDVDIMDKVESRLQGKSTAERCGFLSDLYCKFIRHYMRSEPIVTDIIERWIGLHEIGDVLDSLLSADNDDLIFREQLDFSILDLDSRDALLSHVKKYPYLSINFIEKEDVLKALRRSSKGEMRKGVHETDSEKIGNCISYLKALSQERMRVKNGWAGVHFYMMDVMEHLAIKFDVRQDDIYECYLYDDIIELIESGKTITADEKALRRKGVVMTYRDNAPVVVFGSCFTPPSIANANQPSAALLYGRATTHKKIRGEVKIVVYGNDDKSAAYANKIVVTEMVQPNMVPVFRRSAGMITNEGGVLSHACIISREYGIPCIVGTQSATAVLKDGDRIIMWEDGRVTYDDE